MTPLRRDGAPAPRWCSVPTLPSWLAFPLDALGLYLLLAGSDMIPSGWCPLISDGVFNWMSALAACVLARVLMVMSLER